MTNTVSRILPVLTSAPEKTRNDNIAPIWITAPMPPWLTKEAANNGWELVMDANGLKCTILAIAEKSYNPNDHMTARIRVVLLNMHPQAIQEASALEIMAAKYAMKMIDRANTHEIETTNTHLGMMAEASHYMKSPEQYAQYERSSTETQVSGEGSRIYYAVDFFDENSLCHNAVATAEEAMETLDRMRQTGPAGQKITMSITGHFSAADAEKMNSEERGLAIQDV